jgi:hypothetical protein
MPQIRKRSRLKSDRSNVSVPKAGDTGAVVKPRGAALAKLNELWARPEVRRAVWILGVLVLGLNLLEFPRYPYSILHDLSSHASFEYYAAKHFQFGRQVYQNVGPYGYVHYAYTYAGYLPVQKIALRTLCQLGLLLLIAWAGRRLGYPGLELCWWASFFIFVPLSYQGWAATGPPGDALRPLWELDWDQVYGYVTVYLAGLYLLEGRRGRAYILVGVSLLLLLAFLALTKHTLFVLACAAVCAVALEMLLRKDLWAGLLVPALFMILLTILWVVAGQELGNLPAFIQGIFAFSSGYNEAFMVQEALPVTLLAAAVMGLLLGRSLYNWLALGQGVGRALIESALLFIAWKHALVRADANHVPLFAFSAVTLAIPLFFFRLPYRTGGVTALSPWPERWRLAATWAIVPVVALAVLMLAQASPSLGGNDRLERLCYRPGDLWRRLQNNADWILFPEWHLAEMERRLHEVRAAISLPQMKATVGDSRVDVFGMSPAPVLLNDFNYQSRPMPISFAVSNRLLSEANEAFYRNSATAPDFIVCSIYSGLGDRVGIQDDAGAFRALLDNYHPVRTGGGLLLMEKNQGAWRERAEKRALATFDTQFGAQIPLQEWNRQGVWMEVDIEHTFLGKLLAFFYKPPPCALTLTCVGSSRPLAYRFVTSMGASGCMLTPLIQNNHELLSLFQEGAASAALKKVESFGFLCLPHYRLFFKGVIHVRLYSIDTPIPRAAMSK